MSFLSDEKNSCPVVKVVLSSKSGAKLGTLVSSLYELLCAPHAAAVSRVLPCIALPHFCQK